MSVQAIKCMHVVGNISHTGVRWNSNVVHIYVHTAAVVPVTVMAVWLLKLRRNDTKIRKLNLGLVTEREKRL
jgi:hypothetical protein